ncbi:hypothetical protein CCHL11_02445 [Colletotrichum chlorophyti]|uniref:Uncharacterized protein n=1 Tax=Colletotrichum chlorophyti TaxID=708187 RepID=A0A1Q8S5S5_9PEZI|nr:hypothetical protein CCHL11_02445 [Colletotrichum chlorophyti]
MIRSKRGLGDSIWASRGKAQTSNPSSASRPRANPPPTSVITPAAPLPPSPTKNDVSHSSNNAAPSAVSATENKRSGPSAQQEFKRYIQIVRRLKWKLPYLSNGYHHAIAKPGDAMYGGEVDAEEAELMFKLDFYEYYMLLERALVHLMGVFGVTVTRGSGTPNGSSHTYHQNVIAALEKRDNPLHEALGTGEVLFCLSRAKELRNRWKYAEEGAKVRGEAGRERAGTAPLESYDLDRIFRYIFAGFDAGYAVAERKVAEEVAGGGGGGSGGEGMEMEEDEFDFMVEAMDWEAV